MLHKFPPNSRLLFIKYLIILHKSEVEASVQLAEQVLIEDVESVAFIATIIMSFLKNKPPVQALANTQDPEFKYLVVLEHSVQAAAFPPSVHFPATQSLWHASQIPAEFSTFNIMNCLIILHKLEASVQLAEQVLIEMYYATDSTSSINNCFYFRFM